MIKYAKLKKFDGVFLDVGHGENYWWLIAIKKIGLNNLTRVDPYIKKDVNNKRIRSSGYSYVEIAYVS
jgi:hypothetical protein